ncbi:MAG: DUF1549 domain-containing protein [Verrucomicrobiales bacterium]
MRSLLRPWALLLAVVCVGGWGRAAVDPASATIDKLVADGLTKAGMKPNPPVTDEVFLRRIYVDVIGRIPTAGEARAFLDDAAPDKRSKLIDTLLASEGYVSNWFNYWADVLRIKSNANENGQDGAGDAYTAWMKRQLRDNVSYQKFVHSMLTADGYVWDNGAVGYYMRDAGMPLDNMANTTQIFLGSRVACAQCHNHPFDDYKQRDFYEMAAYTVGIDTRVRAQDIIAQANGVNKVSKSTAKKMEGPGVTEVLDDLLAPLSYGIRHDPDRPQLLPADFRGDPKNPSPRDGKPGEEVKAKPVFSREKIKTGKNILDHYALWMTSPDNPTFTTLIANRLWKSAFGIGLIEPVDDIKKVDLDRNNNDASKLASNPALMAFLTQHMKSVGYDMKKFLRTIYNTQIYQRATTTEEVLAIEEYKFPGPVVRRLSAEQLWDSMVAMVIPSSDERKASGGYNARLAKMKEQATQVQEKLRVGKGRALLDYARARAKVETEFDGKQRPWRDRLTAARTANDAAGIKAAQAEIEKLEAARFDARKKVEEEHKVDPSKAASSSPFSKPAPAMMTDKDKMMKKADEPIVSEADQQKWAGYDASWIRASELPSPAPYGHFLREFGQSEREIIQAADNQSSVTQALLMLNSRLFNDLTAKNTQLGKIFLGVTTPDEKRDQLFLTLLSRLPNDREKEIVANQIKADGADKGLRKVAWALFNTREYSFIQ